MLKELAYFFLVHSNLELSATVWDPHYTKNIKALDKASSKICGR